MIRPVLLLLLSALALAACGKKGEFRPADQKSTSYPRTYPSP